MKTPRKIEFPDCRYKVTDYNVIDAQKEVNNGREVYIRAILDSACNEYQHSIISEQERLDIITQLGLDNLTALLAEYYKVNNKQYNARQVAHFTAFLLTKDSQFLDATEG